MNIKNFIKESARHVLMFSYYHTRKRNEKSVYFASFSATQYSDSPKYVSEKSHELEPDIKIVWSVPDKLKNVIPSYVTTVSPQSVESIKAQAQASAWVFNGVLPYGTYKGKNTFYVQTWHGDRAFKQIGHDAYSSMGRKYYGGYAKYVEPKECDLFTVASTFGKKMIQSAFGYNGEFLDIGIPRNDILVNADKNLEKIKKIKKSLGIADTTKILLFAPTFRDHSADKQNSVVNLSDVLNILDDKGKWVCLVRAHALSSGIDLKNNSDNRLIDATGYPDMAELLLVSDCLVTDYSSSAQDFILMNKPVVLAQYDIEEYTHKSRSLYYDPMETGFLIAHNQEEIEKIFSHLDEYDHAAISKKVQQFYGMHEGGNSTQKVCELIIENCKSK